MPMSRAMRALPRRLPVCIPSVEHNRGSAGLLPSPPGKPLPASSPPCSSCGLAPAALACWWSVFLVMLCAVTLSPPPIQHSGCIPYSSLHCMQNGHGPSSPMSAPNLLPTLLRISPSRHQKVQVPRWHGAQPRPRSASPEHQRPVVYRATVVLCDPSMGAARLVPAAPSNGARHITAAEAAIEEPRHAARVRVAVAHT